MIKFLSGCIKKEKKRKEKLHLETCDGKLSMHDRNVYVIQYI